jgi:hypothetical protein
MHWYAVTLLFAATVLGAPTPVENTLSIASDVRNQGNGFYVATFDEAGVANVTFTPLAILEARNSPTSAPVSENLAARSIATLSRRNTECHGRSANVADLDSANVNCANNANNKYYSKNTWVWVSSFVSSVL